MLRPGRCRATVGQRVLGGSKWFASCVRLFVSGDVRKIILDRWRDSLCAALDPNSFKGSALRIDEGAERRGVDGLTADVPRLRVDEHRAKDRCVLNQLTLGSRQD